MNYWPQTTIVGPNAGYAVTVDDRAFWCNAAAGAIVFNLPSVVGKAALYFVFKKTDTSTYTITVNPPAGKTIDGATTYVLTQQNQIIGVVADTTGNFFLVDGNSTGSAVGQGRAFIEKSDGNVPLGANANISGMTQALHLDTAGNVIISVSGSYSVGSVSSANIGVEIDGVAYDWSVWNAQVGAGSDTIYNVAGSHTMGIFLNSGDHTIKLRAGGSNATLLASTAAMPTSLIIQYPTVVTFGGGSPTSDPTNDLNGVWTNPIVVGLQDDNLPTKIANGYLRRNANNTGWMLDPTLLTLYKDATNRLGPRNTIDFKDATNIITRITEDITNNKFIVSIESTATGGGGGASAAESMLLKSFFSGNSVLPATTVKEELYTYPAPDGTQFAGGTTTSRSQSTYKETTTGVNVNLFWWDLGALRSKALMIVSGYVPRQADYAIFFSDTLPSTNEVPNKTYLIDAALGAYSLYKFTGGTFTQLGSTVTMDTHPTLVAMELAFYYDDNTDRLLAWTRRGAECWTLLFDTTDTSLTTVRYAGIRINAGAAQTFFHQTPIAIYYD